MGNVKLRLLFLLFGITNLVTAQEPPPFFKFDYRKLATGKDDMIKQYEFTTYNFQDSVQFERNMQAWEKERLVRNINDSDAYIFIYGESLPMPYRGSIIRLSIEDRYSKKIMNIFIRVSYNIGYGDEVALNNLSFLAGDYFLDMCGSSPKYKIPAQKFSYEKNIDLIKVKQHKISLKKLNEILMGNMNGKLKTLLTKTSAK